MKILRILKALWNKKFYIIGAPLLSIAALFFYYHGSSEKYSSTATIATDLSEASDGEAQLMDLLDMMKSDISYNLLSYKLLLHDIQNNNEPFRHINRNEIKKVFKSYRNFYFDSGNDRYGEIEQLVGSKLKNFERLKRESEENQLLSDILRVYKYNTQNLQKHLTISRSSGNDLISIHFNSEDPELSAFAVNAFSREFIRYYENIKRNQNAPVELTAVLEEKKAILDRKKVELSQLKMNESETVNLDYNMSQLKDFTIKKGNLLDEIRSLQLQIQSTNKKIEEANKSDLAKASNVRIVQLQNKINEINQIYINSGSNNKQLEQTIQDLREELRNEMNKVSTSNREMAGLNVNELESKKEELQLQLRIVRTNLNSIENNIRSLSSNVNGLTDRRSEISEMEKEVEAAMNEYLAALHSFDKASKQNPLKASLAIITPGIPEAPQKKHETLAYTVTGSASMFLTIMLILLGYVTDSRIKNPLRFKNKTHLQLAGIINEINSDEIDLNRLFSKEQDNEEYEAFKQLLRKIRNEIQSYEQDKVFLFTSPKKGEGKSFLILCLSYSLSLLNKRVLIIDTNFKNNTLTQILSPEAIETNLVELKRKLITDPNFGKAPIDASDKQLLQAFNPEFIEESASPVISVHDNIDIIGSKQVNQSPSEIFAGKNFKNLLHELSFEYDYIFLEGPSLNDFSDTPELVQFVDKVAPVFSAKNSIRQKDKDSINYLKRLNGKLMHAILNKVDLEDLEM